MEIILLGAKIRIFFCRKCPSYFTVNKKSFKVAFEVKLLNTRIKNRSSLFIYHKESLQVHTCLWCVCSAHIVYDAILCFFTHTTQSEILSTSLVHSYDCSIKATYGDVAGSVLLYYALRQAPQIYETLVCVMLRVHNKFYNNILYYAFAL